MLVGLGNPGRAYEGTRHNVGFAVVAALIGRHRLPPLSARGKVKMSQGAIAGHPVVLVCPQSLMNLSGEAVAPLARRLQVKTDAMLVVHDELDLPLGVQRIKAGGGHGGHRGLKSLIQHLDADFVRLRVGIGRPPAGQDAADYVLGAPRGADARRQQDAVIAAMVAVEAILTDGVAAAMGWVNRAARDGLP